VGVAGMGVFVAVAAAVGGSGVLVGAGAVGVGAMIPPSPQPKIAKLMTKRERITARWFLYMVLLRCHGHTRRLLIGTV
jgi:hypothetical protein